MNEPEIVSWKSQTTERGTTLFFVTLNGRILGDSRPYSTAEEARAEAIRMHERSVVDHVTTRVYRPGF